MSTGGCKHSFSLAVHSKGQSTQLPCCYASKFRQHPPTKRSATRPSYEKKIKPAPTYFVKNEGIKKKEKLKKILPGHLDVNEDEMLENYAQGLNEFRAVRVADS